MDLDELDGPSKPARVSRFMPRSKNAPPKPKPEPAVKKEPAKPVPKSEPEPPQLVKPKPEALDDVAEKKEEKQEEGAYGDDSNGAVKMETGEEPKEGNDDPMEEDDAEDTVVREIDVFFNPNVDSNTQVCHSYCVVSSNVVQFCANSFSICDFQLYVLQYPLRPRWRPYELEDRCEEVRFLDLDDCCVERLVWEELQVLKLCLVFLQIRVKPGTAEVEVDLSIDLYSKNCDQEFANRLKMTKQVDFGCL